MLSDAVELRSADFMLFERIFDDKHNIRFSKFEPNPLSCLKAAKIFERSGANVVAEAYCNVCSFI